MMNHQFNVALNWFISIFGAVLLHELAHTFAAKKLNHYVEYVYVDIFNGAAMIDTTYSSYRDTLLIVGAGPLSNLLLYLSSSFIPGLEIFSEVNLLLFIFNILPIYPMDGGRITKVICQWLTKPSIGRKINGYISIVASSVLLLFSLLVYKSLFMVVFSGLFIYYSYLEIKQKY
jgi:stage IV sporulation protein FB